MGTRKNILYVHYGQDWIRGSERCLLDLIRGLDKAQFTPIVWSNCPALHKEVLRCGIHSECGTFQRLFVTQGHKLDFNHWYHLVKQGCEMIEDFDIDLIHVNSAAPCQWMTIASRLTRVPLVTQLHSEYPAFERLVYGLHMSPHIIAVSAAITEYLVHDGYPADRISVVHNGVDIQRFEHDVEFQVKDKLKIPQDHYLFATVGSLIYRKGVDRIISALRHVTLEYPNTHLLVIGEGPMRVKLEQMAEYMNLDNRVHFVGEQTQILSWLQGCDGFVSGARQEAFGLVINEAGLAQLPIVAPDEGGIPEIVTHQRTGLLYKNAGIGPMVKCMRAVIKNRTSAKGLGIRAKAHVLEKHSSEENVRKIQNVYHSTLKEKRAAKLKLWRTISPLRTYLSKRFAFGGS